MAAFLSQFFKNPAQMGSIIPSSRWLADALIAGLDLKSCKIIVEYGPGMGAITKKVYPFISDNIRFVAVEPNLAFAKFLQIKYPKIEMVRDYASHLKEYFPGEGACVDVILSSLPLTLMKWTDVEETLEITAAILKPGGQFRLFFYVHMFGTKRVRNIEQTVKRLFSSVESDLVIRNFPPAVILRCYK